MNITHAYMLQGSYGTGGMTVAMLRRCKEFNKHGIKCTSLTVDHVENLYAVDTLKKAHGIPDEISFKNPFIELSDKADQWLASVNQDIAHHYLLTYLDKNANEVVYYHTNGSQYGTTPYFETCITNKKFSNSEGGGQKLIACTYVLKARKQKIELTFSLQGLCTTISIQNSETNEWEGFLVFDYDTGVITDYGNSYNFRCAWLNDIISLSPNPEKTVAICDGVGSMPKMQYIKGKSKKIAVLHNNHANFITKKPHVKEQWAIEHSDIVDAFLVQTEQQKDALIERFGKRNFAAIPNFIELENTVLNDNSYDDMRIGLFSRLTDNKGVKDAIEMMSILHKMGVKAHLEIFGSLPLKKDYENALKKYNRLIETLNLQDYVHLRGHTNQVAMEMSQCCVGIMPTYSESFCLVIAEFMLSGIPVVSYDCDYGPATMIEHGKNSFLVKVGDQKAMAKYVAKLIKDKALRKEMSQTAKTSITQLLDKERIYGLWENLFDTLK